MNENGKYISTAGFLKILKNQRLNIDRIKYKTMSFHRKYNSLFKLVDNLMKLYKIYKKDKKSKKEKKHENNALE